MPRWLTRRSRVRPPSRNKKNTSAVRNIEIRALRARRLLFEVCVWAGFRGVWDTQSVAVPNNDAVADGQQATETASGVQAGAVGIEEAEFSLLNFENRDICLGAFAQSAELRPFN